MRSPSWTAGTEVRVTLASLHWTKSAKNGSVALRCATRAVSVEREGCGAWAPSAPGTRTTLTPTRTDGMVKVRGVIGPCGVYPRGLTDRASAAVPNANVHKHTFPLKTGRRQLQALVRPHSLGDSG